VSVGGALSGVDRYHPLSSAITPLWKKRNRLRRDKPGFVRSDLYNAGILGFILQLSRDPDRNWNGREDKH
jgi:hypothetical protein